jgi:hypothetical protein
VEGERVAEGSAVAVKRPGSEGTLLLAELSQLREVFGFFALIFIVKRLDTTCCAPTSPPEIPASCGRATCS